MTVISIIILGIVVCIFALIINDHTDQIRENEQDIYNLRCDINKLMKKD